MTDFNDIWKEDTEGRQTLTEAQLLAYMEGRLSGQEQREIEELLSREGLESDALEGLQQLSVNDTKALRHRINQDLQKVLHKKRRHRRGLTEQRWTWLAIGIILLLAIVCYALMYLAEHPAH